MSPAVLTTSIEHADALTKALDTNAMTVVAYCAAWCNTCGEFRAGLGQLAQARPDVTFAWIDIEDDAEVAGDIDVENFPTIAVFADDRLVHYGISLPQIPVLSRLIASLGTDSPTLPGTDPTDRIVERLGGQAARATSQARSVAQ